MRDLLGVTSLDGKPVSEALVGDVDGPMTPDAWRIYKDVGAKIARAVMTGPNRNLFLADSCQQELNSACLSETIKDFGRKIFRRPLKPEEVQRFEALGQGTPAGTPEEVAEAILYGFLVSPSFLLVPELSTEMEDGKYKLSSHEVATRLALLLWGSVPDETLNKAADDNQLQTPEQILAQAKRMIGVRERTGPLLAAFHRDWIQMNNPAGHWWKMDHDPQKYPHYDPAVKPTLQAELDMFFEEVAFSGGSVKELFLSNVAFVNRDNAVYYGLDPAAYGTELTRVELDPVQRPGFISRAGFLSSYSNYDATSPILRGAFINVYMLGVNPGAPIPDAAQARVEGEFKTQREYIEALTKPANCIGCHSIINPAGYVLENYDATGKWQTTDPRGGAINATATVSFGGNNTKMISSPLELMQEIVATPKAGELYVQAWVSYAFGRSPNSNDRCIVEQLNVKLSQDGYGILDMMADLTQADSFRLRVRATP